MTAHDDAETTYFNESHAEAKQAVESALGMYDDLLSQLDEKERGKCQRAMGLKVNITRIDCWASALSLSRVCTASIAPECACTYRSHIRVHM